MFFSNVVVEPVREESKEVVEKEAEESDEEKLGEDSVKVKAAKRRASCSATVSKKIMRSNGRFSLDDASDLKENVDEDDEDNAPLVRMKSPKKRKKCSPALTLNPSARKRRTLSGASLTSIPDRAIFPIEVKIGAIERISRGETHTAVARDLQCPVSTVASWWYRRSGIKNNKREMVNSSGEESTGDSGSCPAFANLIINYAILVVDSTSQHSSSSTSHSSSPSPESVINEEGGKVYALVPYERNAILEKMRQKVEEAFKHREIPDDSIPQDQVESVQPRSDSRTLLVRRTLFDH